MALRNVDLKSRGMPRSPDRSSRANGSQLPLAAVPLGPAEEHRRLRSVHPASAVVTRWHEMTFRQACLLLLLPSVADRPGVGPVKGRAAQVRPLPGTMRSARRSRVCTP